MRSSESEKVRPIRDLLRRLIKAPAALSILWPAILVVGGYAAWHRWGTVHVAERYSGVDATLIQVRPAAPAFVRTNVVKDVYRDTAMDGLSLLDRQATAKIASAFSMHPWVRNVIGVQKLPGGVIDVRLEYRNPVAMVHVVQRDESGGQTNGFFPVDGDGVLLPTKQFAPVETRQYLYIEVPGMYALDSHIEGTPFGDRRVEAAARLAEVLAPYREQARLRSIGVHGDPRLDDVPQLELTTHDNARKFWGGPPGAELPGEGTVEMKLRKLLSGDPTENADLRMAGPTITRHR